MQSSIKRKTYCTQVFPFRGPTSQLSDCPFCYRLPNQNNRPFNVGRTLDADRPKPNASQLFSPLAARQMLYFLSTLPSDLITASRVWTFLFDASLLGSGFIIFISLNLCWRVVEYAQVYLEFIVARG